MARTVLTNANWKQLEPLFPKRGPAKHRRRRLEGILWVHRTGAPWRDLPRTFGPWRSVRSCFERWSDSGLWARIWEAMRRCLGEDHEALYLDSTSVKAHRHSAGARGKGEEAIGTSRGGRGTKIHAVCDGLGYPLAFELTPAQTSDVTRAEGLLEAQEAGQVVADRGYDSDALRETIKARGAKPVIPGRKNRKEPVIYDKHCYGSRHVHRELLLPDQGPSSGCHSLRKNCQNIRRDGHALVHPRLAPTLKLRTQPSITVVIARRW